MVFTETTADRTNAKPVYPVQIFSPSLSSAQEFICKNLLLHKRAGALFTCYSCSHTLLEKASTEKIPPYDYSFVIADLPV